MSKWIIVRTTLVIKPHWPPSKCQPRLTDLYLKEAELVQSFLEFDFNRRRRRTGQEINQLHLTRIHRDGLWMREFVIDDPFRPVGESIRNKDMAAVGGRIPNVPPVKNQLAMDAFGSQSRGEGDCIIHALTILSFAFKCRITGNLVVQRSVERENAQHEAGKNAG